MIACDPRSNKQQCQRNKNRFFHRFVSLPPVLRLEWIDFRCVFGQFNRQIDRTTSKWTVRRQMLSAERFIWIRSIFIDIFSVNFSFQFCFFFSFFSFSICDWLLSPDLRWVSVIYWYFRGKENKNTFKHFCAHFLGNSASQSRDSHIIHSVTRNVWKKYKICWFINCRWQWSFFPRRHFR